MDTDWSRYSDRNLKRLAFVYHYGTWRNAEEAKASLAGQAAAEQARRQGVKLHEPFLMDENFLQKRLEETSPTDTENLGEKLVGFKKTVAVDFDGVIHAYRRGWEDGVIYDDPMPGTKEALAALSSRYRLVIYTARNLSYKRNGEELLEVDRIWQWLEEHDLARFIDQITSVKPQAIFYIDDRAIRFTAWDEALELLGILEEGAERKRLG